MHGEVFLLITMWSSANRVYGFYIEAGRWGGGRQSLERCGLHESDGAATEVDGKCLQVDCHFLISTRSVLAGWIA